MPNQNENPVPRKEVDEALFKNAPAALRALHKQARKELRVKARASWKAKRGLAS